MRAGSVGAIPTWGLKARGWFRAYHGPLASLALAESGGLNRRGKMLC
ncbi:hypothetical protein BKA18_006946 [Streptomyces auratus]